MTAVGLQYCIELERTGGLNNCLYHLYTNDYVPAVGSALNNFTECNDAGYTMWGPNFAPSVINAAQQGEIDGPAKTFTFAFDKGGFTVYGYYVTNSQNVVIYAERAPAPFTVTAAGQTYTVVPKKLLGTM
jgi:hypothetical protein